jgi:DNA mismatch repair protein MutS
VRGRSKGATPQLELFVGPAPVAREATNPAIDLLKAVDIDRLTPLEALGMLAKLKSML